MRQRQNKAARTTKGMEIVDSKPVFGKPEKAANTSKTPPKDDGFTIVETVSGPAPGTFGLSDVWEKD